MEIISIEKKTFEELVLRLGQFVKRMDSINRQRSSRRMSDLMDNQDVCQALKISPRTLQTLRDSGRLPHSKINNRIYYRPEDVERLIENELADQQKIDRLLFDYLDEFGRPLPESKRRERKIKDFNIKKYV